MLSLKINRDLILSLFFILAFIFGASYFYFSNLIFIILYSLLPFIFFFIKPVKLHYNLLLYPSLIFLIFLVEVLFFSGYFRKEEAILWLCVAYSSFFYAYFMYVNKYRILINKVFLLVYIFFIWYFIFTVFLGFNNIDIYNNILPGYSRNILSAIVIFLTFNLALSYYQVNQKTPIFYIILCFLTCLFLLGRSGIIVSSLFLIFHMFFYYKNNLNLLFLFLFLFYFIFGFDVIGYLQDHSNFKNGLESSRSDLIDEYMTGLFYSNESVFFGRDYDECCSLALSYNGNIHNSFLSGHAKYGVLHTIFTIFLLIFIIFFRNWYITLLAFLIFIRYFYDQMGFFGIYDISILYLILILVMKKSEISK